MKLFNTLTMTKEDFVPQRPGKVTLYACGPTVYDLIHMGNARPVILFDALRRYLEYRGFEVIFVQNFTDIDDKIIRRAAENGLDPKALADQYIGEYFLDARGLGVKEATVHPRATENMDAILDMVRTLVDTGYAYPAGGDVYFRTERFDGYGRLSRQPKDQLLAGARIDVGELKESPMDFVLWKAAKPGEPSWPSPWGAGRPGWHIECSAMAGQFLPEPIDIHCGGQDLIFPHHENEIAQAEAANGHTFANYWLHNGFISIDNKKMSKSLGNFFTVRDAAEQYGYDAIRMFMLMSHYRSPLSFSPDILLQAKNGLERLYTAASNLEFVISNAQDVPLTDEEIRRLEALNRYRAQFIEALDDDFNTADAIAAIFELVRELNIITTENPLPTTLARGAQALFLELTDVLGLLYGRGCGQTLESEVEALITLRQTARKEKDYAGADRIRAQLKDVGITLEDTPQGVKWKRSSDG